MFQTEMVRHLSNRAAAQDLRNLKCVQAKFLTYQNEGGEFDGAFTCDKSIYASTQRHAISKLADAGWRVDHGLPLQAAKRTVAEYMNYWLEVTRRRVR
jgi:hypothetical protein